MRLSKVTFKVHDVSITKPLNFNIMKMSNLMLLLAVLCLFAACKRGGSSYEPINNQDKYATADSASSTSGDTAGAKLLRTASMDMKVKDVQDASTQIMQLTSHYKGMVTHHEIQSQEVNSKDMPLSQDSMQRVTVYRMTGNITAKVPVESLEQFLNQASQMGLHVNVRRMDIEDRTLDYLSAQLKLNSRTQIIDQQKSGKIKIKDPASVLYLKDDMIDQKINNRRIDDAVKNSTVDFSLYQNDTVNIEHVANDNPSAYQISFLQRMAFALSNGCTLFADFIIGLANLWVFLVLGVILWFIVKYYKIKWVSPIKSV